MSRRIESSLRAKLQIFAILCVSIPAVALTVFTTVTSRGVISRQVRLLVDETARNAADRIQAALRAREEQLRVLTTQGVMRELRIGDLDKRVAALLQTALRGIDGALELRVVDDSGASVASTKAPDPSQGLAPPSPPEEGWRGPFESRFHGARVLERRLPIPDPDRPGGTIGELVAFVDWATIQGSLVDVRRQAERAGLDLSVVILDGDGTRLGGVDADRDGAPAAGYRDPEFLVGEVTLAVGEPSSHHWRLLVAERERHALEPVRRATQSAIAVLGLVLVAGIGAAAYWGGRLTEPLRELTAATVEVGRGESLPALEATSASDEVGDLARAFQKMSEDLRAVRAELVRSARFSAIGEISAGVAHSVRTALGSLGASAQMLRRCLPDEDPQVGELLEIIDFEVSRLDRMVRRLLQLGADEVAPREAVTLANLAERAGIAVAPKAKAASVALSTRSESGDATAYCDEERILDALVNLVANAIEACPPGGKVEIASFQEEAARGLEVRDDGPGIPPDVQRRLFEPFVTGREDGVGLGLAYVKRVVEEHDGRVSARRENERTIFRIELPESSLGEAA